MSKREERRRGIATRAVHARPATDGAPGEPVVSPIVPSTTFAFEAAQAFASGMAAIAAALHVTLSSSSARVRRAWAGSRR